MWTEKTMLSENVDAIKIDTQSWVSKMPVGRWESRMARNGANFVRRYLEMRMHPVHLSMRTEGTKAF